MAESVSRTDNNDSSRETGGKAFMPGAFIPRIEACVDETTLMAVATDILSSTCAVPFSACVRVSPDSSMISDYRMLFTADQPNNLEKTVALTESLNWAGSECITLAKQSWSKLDIAGFCGSRGFEAETIIACPCSTAAANYFFLFADKQGSMQLSAMRDTLQQLIAMVRLKLENLWLRDKVKNLSLDFEATAGDKNSGLNRAVTSLRESEDRYRSIFNSNADAILVFDTAGNIVDANGLACKTYCYSYAEMVKLSGKDIVHPDYAGLFGKFKDTEPGQWFETESVDMRKGGVPFDIEIHGTKFLQGGAELLLAIVRDITERKNAELALRESESKYRNLVENIEETHFLYTHDTQGVFTYVSPSISQMLGYAQDDFLSHYTRYLTDHPINKEAMRHTELSLQGLRQPPYQVEITHSDGSVKWLEVSESPVTNEQGTVESIQGIARDITEKRKAEEALFESKEQLRATFDNAAIGIMIGAPMGPVTRANKALVKMLGYSKAELFARSFLELVHPDDRKKLKSQMLALLAGSRQSLRLEKRLIRKDGRTAWGRLHVSALRGQEGSVNFIIAAIEDITGLKEIEEVVRQKDIAIRESYANVISAITGDRLIISTPEDVDTRLGKMVEQPFRLGSYADLHASRSYLRDVIEREFPGCTALSDIIAASGEAAANMVKHAAGGTITVYRKDQTVQLLMSDTGDGIHFTLLPRATLLPGFSTKQSLGVGFSIMLEMSDQLTLSTQPGKTVLLLERDAYKDKAESLPPLIQRVDE